MIMINGLEYAPVECVNIPKILFQENSMRSCLWMQNFCIPFFWTEKQWPL